MLPDFKCKGPFTLSESQNMKAKKIKEQSEEIKRKNSNIKENFRFRSNKDQRKKSFSVSFLDSLCKNVWLGLNAVVIYIPWLNKCWRFWKLPYCLCLRLRQEWVLWNKWWCSYFTFEFDGKDQRKNANADVKCEQSFTFVTDRI